MKKTFILSLMAAMIVCSCSKEEAQQEASTSPGNGKTVTVYIDGETANSTVSAPRTEPSILTEDMPPVPESMMEINNQ